MADFGADDAAAASAADAQLTVQFSTRLPVHLRVPDTPVAIPAATNRYGLSQIINALLECEPRLPFDFLVSGQLLRGSLAQHVAAEGFSTEEVVEIEYQPAVLPPKPVREQPQEEWVGCLDSLGGRPLAGLYDGVVRLWDDQGEPCCSAAAHSGPVTAVRCCEVDGQQLVVSGGKDGLLKLWAVLPSLDGSGGKTSGGGGKGTGAARALSSSYSSLPPPELRLLATLHGHEDGVTAAAAHGGRLISSGWQGTLRLHDVAEAVARQAEAAASAPSAAEASTVAVGGGGSKRKGAGTSAAAGKGAAPGAAAAVATAVEAGPVAEMTGHQGCASCVVWPSAGVAASGGWDHSVRLWDVERRTERDSYHGAKAVYCLAAMPTSGGAGAGGGNGPFAFGGADNLLRVWDPRDRRGEALAVKGLVSHRHWVSAVAWRPGSEWHVATGSHDKTVKLWDLRAPVPLHTVEGGHEDKVLAVTWLDSNRLVSGGADCKMITYDMSLSSLGGAQ